MRTIDAADGTLSADQLTLRRTNLGLVLRRLRDHGPRSRATLATELGHDPVRGLRRWSPSSPSAAWSAPAASSAARRPPRHRASSSTATRCAGLGAEINVNHVSTMALDLARRGGRASTSSPSTPARLAGRGGARPARRAGPSRPMADVARRDVEPVGLTVGVAGLVDRDARRAHPRSQPRLARRAGRRPAPRPPRRRRTRSPSTTRATWPRIAEATPGDPHRQDVLVIFGEVGVGGGIVADGRLLRGRQGYAGEFGHMIVEPQGRRLRLRPGRAAGRRSVGLRALLDAAADPDDPVRDPALAHRRPARRDQPARRPRRHPHPRRARPGRRLGRRRRRDAGQRAQPGRDRAQRLLRRGRPPHAPGHRGRGCRPACSRPTPAAPASSSPRSASPPPSAAAPASRSRPSSPTRPGSTRRTVVRRSRPMTQTPCCR